MYLILILAQQASTIDIQPLSIMLHENDLRKLVNFFVPYTPIPSSSAIPPPISTTTANPTITKPNKTKVIVENLELILGTGTSDSGNTVRLKARQLFFAAQPFKAGVVEGKKKNLSFLVLNLIKVPNTTLHLLI
jgi:hypothetical protein